MASSGAGQCNSELLCTWSHGPEWGGQPGRGRGSGLLLYIMYIIGAKVRGVTLRVLLSLSRATIDVVCQPSCRFACHGATIRPLESPTQERLTIRLPGSTDRGGCRWQRKNRRPQNGSGLRKHASSLRRSPPRADRK